MLYQIDYQAFQGIFAVPESVTALLPACSGTALKVLLLILSQPKEAISSAHLAGQLGLPPADVEEALDYWQQHGILRSKNNFAAPDSGEQLSLNKPKIRRVSQRHSLSQQEILQLSSADPNIPSLIQEAQSLLGRTLSSPEQETLCSFYTYDHLSVEYLLLVLMYCIKQKKTHFRYFEKVVNSLLEKEVDTYDKAEHYLDSFANQEEHENLVRSVFGIYDRSLTAKEKAYINNWFDVFGFDISLVKLAYERTIDSIGKTSFPYTNKILTAWHEKGIKNTQEASMESSKGNAGGKRSSGKAGGLASSFDLDELQELLNKGGNSPF